jgi:hypothetical protein
VGFLNKILVAKSQPRDCSINILIEFVLYILSISGCNSVLINCTKISDFPVVGKSSLYFLLLVGKVKSLFLSTLVIPKTIDYGIILIQENAPNCTSLGI